MRNYALYLAWVISLTGLLISLYFGELLQYEPCRLCWYQRIFLFPLAIILAIGAYRHDHSIISYCLPLPLLGGAFALYHVLEQYFPALRISAICGHTNSCTEVAFYLFGFLSFPLLSLIGFILIAALFIYARKGLNSEAE